jgi:long-chain acyl-CoA synthetase
VTAEELLAQDFGIFDHVIAAHATERAEHPALVMNERRLSYAQLDTLMNRIAAAFARDGVELGEAVAVCATTSIEYAALYLGILRAGAAVVPLAPSSTAESLAAMIADCGARSFFLDADVSRALEGVSDRISARRIALDGSSAAGEPFERWLAPPDAKPDPVAIAPELAFNVIYSSGTTGSPKGIVQSHKMRWAHIRRRFYGTDSVSMISTPLYSNTTLVSFLPTLSNGGTAVLMAKFDVASFLAQAQANRATHAMLVPVQYKRLMDYADFDRFDLSSFRMKFATSAPFAAELKAEVLKRWPGGLVEYYGMTEGGGSCILIAHQHPDKLHTVGQPAPGHDIRLIGEDGKEVAKGEIGEIVGHSGSIMNGYHNQPGKTSEAEWHDATGKRFIRTGDLGRFDEEGFLTLMDRKKDMIISGGFNIYPSDLEAEIILHPAVLEAAVVGVASERWGETPVAFVALKPGFALQAEEIKAWVNARVGKTQRLAALQIVDSLPRSHIGKVLKRELRESYKLPAER